MSRYLWLLLFTYLYTEQSQGRYYQSVYQVIPQPLLAICRVSRLGNHYDAIIPSPALQQLIDNVPITISQKIPKNSSINFVHVIRDALPQRINHEVLGKILLPDKDIPPFAIQVMMASEIVQFFGGNQAMRGVDGTFHYPTNTLILSAASFMDEAWKTLYTVANELSHAALFTLPIAGQYDSTQKTIAELNQAVAQLHEKIAPALQADWLLLTKLLPKLYLTTKKKKISRARPSYYEALFHYHPSLNHYTAGASCRNIKRYCPVDSLFLSSVITLYRCHANTELLYALNSTASDYSLCSKTHRGCYLNYFTINPFLLAPHDVMHTFARELERVRAKTVGKKKSIAAYADKSSPHVDVMEDSSNVDSYHPVIKQAFFPTYCQTKTQAMGLSRNYCGY